MCLTYLNHRVSSDLRDANLCRKSCRGNRSVNEFVLTSSDIASTAASKTDNMVFSIDSSVKFSLYFLKRK